MLTWTLAGAILLGAPALKEVRKPAKPPEGEWTVERLECSGSVTDESGYADKPTARVTATKSHLLFRGVEVFGPWGVSWFSVGGRLEADFETDNHKTVSKAIWRIEGGTLQICKSGPGEARPTEFTAPKGSGRTLWVYARKPV